MPLQRRCICQHENPNSPYPAGSDGCVTSRPARPAPPRGVELPRAEVLAAVATDHADARPSLADLVARDAQACLTGVRRPMGGAPVALPAPTGLPDLLDNLVITNNPERIFR